MKALARTLCALCAFSSPPSPLPALPSLPSLPSEARSLSPLLLQTLSVSADQINEAKSILNTISPVATFNVPSDDFWYPPFMIGNWKMVLKFNKAEFDSKMPVDAAKDHLPGFEKYSIAFLPEVGEDISCNHRFVQIDSHPREDHPYNIRQLITALSPSTVIDSAAYNFRKAPDWFHSPANHWTIKYHDQTGKGEIELLTKKRNIDVFAGSVNTVEYFHQVCCPPISYHVWIGLIPFIMFRNIDE
jgi:hypothetical protein